MAYQILWIDDDRTFLAAAGQVLGTQVEFHCATSVRDGMLHLHSHPCDLVLLDLSLGKEDGMGSIATLRKEYPTTAVIVVSGQKDTQRVVDAIRAGAADYLCKPFEPSELRATIEKVRSVRSMQDRHDALIADLNPARAHRSLIGVSPAFQSVMRQADRVKGHNANILLQGESGTGKELIARHIHGLEDDGKRPFIAVNCAAIPEGLIESELFGHERGAFTGANQRKLGKFELASGGDIFLDEICALRLELQSKILRVLQEREIVRVGGSYPIRVKFRVIAASNENLEQMISERKFRMDLFHRLRVVQVDVPPLRKRREDTPLLIAHFLEKFARGRPPKRITAEALRRLQQYEWPGNVRELENVIQSLVILTPTDIIDHHALPQWTRPQPSAEQNIQGAFPEVKWDTPDDLPNLRRYVQVAERSFIKHVLELNEGDKSATASALSIGRTTLYSKLKELGLM